MPVTEMSACFEFRFRSLHANDSLTLVPVWEKPGRRPDNGLGADLNQEQFAMYAVSCQLGTLPSRTRPVSLNPSQSRWNANKHCNSFL